MYKAENETRELYSEFDLEQNQGRIWKKKLTNGSTLAHKAVEILGGVRK